MDMFKIISMLLVFFRELIFDSKEEYNITSANFSIRKTSTFFILAFMTFLAIMLLYKAFLLSQNNLRLKSRVQELEVKINQTCPSNSQQLPLVKKAKRLEE
jgi:hypothetical protein